MAGEEPVGVPVLRSHITTASPARSIATCGPKADWPGAERSTGPERLPAAERTTACTTGFVPPCCHTVTTSPAWSIARRRGEPLWADSSCAAEKLPRAGRTAACTVAEVWPLLLAHTATASPAGSIATCGSTAFRPAEERSTGDSHAHARPAASTESAPGPSAPNQRDSAA